MTPRPPINVLKIQRLYSKKTPILMVTLYLNYLAGLKSKLEIKPKQTDRQQNRLAENRIRLSDEGFKRLPYKIISRKWQNTATLCLVEVPGHFYLVGKTGDRP